MENIEKIKTIIASLISNKTEGNYWDFKEFYHTNKANLLHDIICMANNLANHDAYIIFGVKDKTFEIVGIEHDTNRKSQSDFVEFLKDKKFCQGIRPEIELCEIELESHTLDILIIKNSSNTPYYLDNDFIDRGRKVRANFIYTRIGDTNTDISKSADVNHVEQLWAKRLKITKRLPDYKIELTDENDNSELKFKHTPPDGLIYARQLDEENDLVDGITIDDIRNYNDQLPEESVIKKYNTELALYENANNNCNRMKVIITNTGDAKGTDVYIDLFFPNELLSYRDYKVEDIKKPTRPKIPKNPIHKVLEKNMLRGIPYFNDPFLSKMGIIEQQLSAFAYPSVSYDFKTRSLLENYDRDYYINEAHSSLTLKLNDLLHTKTYESDVFCVIATKCGTFNIKYEIMCAEYLEPICGSFEIIIERDRENV